MAKQKVGAIRMTIAVLNDQGDQVGGAARYDVVEPDKYPREEILDAFSGTARRSVEYILKGGVN